MRNIKENSMLGFTLKTNDLSEDEYEFFEERAAILQFDAGLSKAEAERRALHYVFQLRRKRMLRLAV